MQTIVGTMNTSIIAIIATSKGNAHIAANNAIRNIRRFFKYFMINIVCNLQ